MIGRPFTKGYKINIGRKHSKEWNDNVGLANKGKHFGRMSEETKAKISQIFKNRPNQCSWFIGKIPWNKGMKMSEEFREKCRKRGISKEIILKAHQNLPKGEKHWNWKGGLKNRKKKNERNDSAYNSWRLDVWRRDSFKCKIGNQDCNGKIKAHHILSWKDYPELRYNINNGITLCQAHHPLRRAEEKRLIPFLQGLVSVSNELI